MPTALSTRQTKRGTKPLVMDADRPVNYYEGGRRLMVAKAQHAERKLQQLEGALVLRTAVEKVTFECSRAVRDGLENIPARVSGPLQGMTDQGQIFAYLSKEIQQVLEALTE